MFNQQFKHLLFEFYRRFILQKYPDLGVSGKSDSNPPPVPLTSITLRHRPI